MGIQFFETKSQPNMKVLLFVALAIAAVVAEPEAEADADAAYYYGNYFGNRGFYGYGMRNWNNWGYGRNYGYGYNYPSAYGYTRHFGKRSADAEPEAEADAEAAVLYSTHYGNQGYYGQRFYGMGNYYGAQWNNGYRYGAYPYASTYGAYPYTSTYGYPARTTYRENHQSSGILRKYLDRLVATSMENTRQFGKRSADAEPEADADAAYYYGNYYNHHQRYYGQRYNGFRTYSAGYPYTYGRNFYGYGNRFGWW